MRIFLTLFQYGLGIAVPVVMIGLVLSRTRPGLTRTMGTIGFSMIALSAILGLGAWLGWVRELPALAPVLLTFGGVINCVIAVIIGAVQEKEGE